MFFCASKYLLMIRKKLEPEHARRKRNRTVAEELESWNEKLTFSLGFTPYRSCRL